MLHPEKVSVIILMHDNAPMTMQCLKSLSNADSVLDHEITLPDNGSTEDTRPVLELLSDLAERLPLQRRRGRVCAEF
jgi:GT2 family glycosyltransferase